jgi:phosphoglycerate kinase
VTFLEDCVGEDVVNQVNNSKGQVFLCENVRFHPEEEGSIKDKEGKKIKSKPEAIQNFRKELSRLGNVYVNDAFGSAHRAHSSVVGINHKFRVAGLLMQKELEYLGGFLQQPKKPVLVILGGSKVTDKIELILNMINIADEIIIGGGMSNPFLRQFHGHKLGITKIDMPADPNTLQQIMDKAAAKGVKIHLPVDGVCAQSYSPTAPTIICDNKDVPEGWEIFDKGPKTVEEFDKVVQRANSIFWNGPIGVFEFPNFKNGSEGLLKSVIQRTKAGATSIIGGGDTASLVLSRGAEKDVSYVSTGGGASLEFMQGIKLPGVEALSEISELN